MLIPPSLSQPHPKSNKKNVDPWIINSIITSCLPASWPCDHVTSKNILWWLTDTACFPLPRLGHTVVSSSQKLSVCRNSQQPQGQSGHVAWRKYVHHTTTQHLDQSWPWLNGPTVSHQLRFHGDKSLFQEVAWGRQVVIGGCCLKEAGAVSIQDWHPSKGVFKGQLCRSGVQRAVPIHKNLWTHMHTSNAPYF